MSEFIDNLYDVFAAFGPIRCKRMFGGHGVYRDNLMFALVADDMLYLKVDQHNESEFAERNLPAFEFNKNGKSMKMSYRLAPEDIYDHPEVAREWAELAFDAALRSRKSR